MSDSYKLRVTLINPSKVKEIIEYIVSCSDMYIVVQEGNENIKDHLHLWVYGTPTRYYLQKVCGKGNKSFSLAKCKEKYPFKYWNYMEKQNEPEMINIPIDIQEKYVEYKKLIKEQLKQSKQDYKKVWEKIYDIVVLEYEKEVNKVIGHFDLDDYILRKVIQYHKENSLVISKHRVFSYIDTIKFNLPHVIGKAIVNTSTMYKDWVCEYKRKIF